MFLQEHFYLNSIRFLSSLARRLCGGLAWFLLLGAENAGENLVDILQLTWQVESVFDLLARHAGGDLFVGEDQLVEVKIFLPGAHGVGLDEAVGVLAGDAMLD